MGAVRPSEYWTRERVQFSSCHLTRVDLTTLRMSDNTRASSSQDGGSQQDVLSRKATEGGNATSIQGSTEQSHQHFAANEGRESGDALDARLTTPEALPNDTANSEMQSKGTLRSGSPQLNKSGGKGQSSNLGKSKYLNVSQHHSTQSSRSSSHSAKYTPQSDLPSTKQASM